MRGLIARNWKGVSGPGHTWAIDSTVGDIYLRSSINRAWIVGRPIVYIIVDVWSTAIVGFRCVPHRPKLEYSKNQYLQRRWRSRTSGRTLGLRARSEPLSTSNLVLSAYVRSGEYLSKAASVTAFRLIPCMSYAPPYRPDLKGLVEVLHRIEKDAQFLFIPGAMNFRREEFDL